MSISVGADWDMTRRDRAQIEFGFPLLLRRVFLREWQRGWAAEHVELRQLERREANLDVFVLQIEAPVLLEFLGRKDRVQQNADRLRDLVRRMRLAAAVADAFWCTWHDSKKANLAPPFDSRP